MGSEARAGQVWFLLTDDQCGEGPAAYAAIAAATGGQAFQLATADIAHIVRIIAQTQSCGQQARLSSFHLGWDSETWHEQVTLLACDLGPAKDGLGMAVMQDRSVGSVSLSASAASAWTSLSVARDGARDLPDAAS